VLQHAIVPDVGIAHDEAVLPDPGAAALPGSAIDRGVLADPGAIPHVHPRLLARVLGVLGIAAQHGASAEPAAVPQYHVPLDHCGGPDHAPRRDSYGGPDHAIGAHFDAVGDSGARIDDRGRVNVRRAHLSAIIAVIDSTSAATWPST